MRRPSQCTLPISGLPSNRSETGRSWPAATAASMAALKREAPGAIVALASPPKLTTRSLPWAFLLPPAEVATWTAAILTGARRYAFENVRQDLVPPMPIRTTCRRTRSSRCWSGTGSGRPQRDCWLAVQAGTTARGKASARRSGDDDAHAAISSRRGRPRRDAARIAISPISEAAAPAMATEG